MVLGLSKEDAARIAQAEDTAPGDETEVWAENWDIVSAFCAVFSQWRVTVLPSGRLLYSGLDYAGARAGLDCAGFAITPDLWSGIRIMESEARQALNT